MMPIKKLIFSIELDGKTYDKREDAGKALLGLVGAAVRATKPVPVGHYAGFEITVEYKPLERYSMPTLLARQRTRQNWVMMLPAT